MSVPAHIKYIILGGLLLGATFNMFSTTKKIMQISKRLEESKKEVLSLKSQKEELEDQIKYKKTQSFIERVAREKLNMILPNEEIYLYSNDTFIADGVPSGESQQENIDGGTTREEASVVLSDKDSVEQNLSRNVRRQRNLEAWKNLLF